MNIATPVGLNLQQNQAAQHPLEDACEAALRSLR